MILADDESELRNLFSKILKIHGYDVAIVAKSGEEVVRLARDGKLNEVEIAIFDYSMGAVNGLEAGIEAAKSNGRLRIIIDSANYEIADKATEQGFVFLRKPFLQNELLNLLDSIQRETHGRLDIPQTH
ncbi:MAG: response regulator [Nitrososphaerales archaeon]